MREDYFIIWTHGLKFVNEIETIISTEHKVSFSIFESKKLIFTYEKFCLFLKMLYKKENPTHIQGKTAFLLNYLTINKLLPIIHIIKVKNLNPQEQYFYNGPKKCKNVETLKIKLRNKFNPKFSNLNKQIFPLEMGVSHNHIIHSSDNSNDINHLNIILNI